MKPELYIVRETRHGWHIVFDENGRLADSSCVEAPGDAVQFEFDEAVKVAERFSFDRGGLCAIWCAIPVLKDTLL